MIALALNKYISADIADLIAQIISRTSDTIPQTENEACLLRWIINHTQESWLRKNDSERWEIEASKSLHEQLADLLEGSNLFLEQAPQRYTMDNVLLMSALESVFIQRLEYFSRLIEKGLKIKNVYLLGGERKLDPVHESAIIKVLESGAREIDMLEHHASKLSKCDTHMGGIDFISSSTPYQTNQQGLKQRPNTRDTVVTWKNEHYQGGSILCLSNQPFVHYQTAVVRSVMGDDSAVLGAGLAANPNEINTSVVLDTLARLLYTSLPKTALTRI